MIEQCVVTSILKMQCASRTLFSASFFRAFNVGDVIIAKTSTDWISRKMLSNHAFTSLLQTDNHDPSNAAALP